MLLAGGYLFVGYHTGQEGIIKVWNVATGASHMLPGHKVRDRGPCCSSVSGPAGRSALPARQPPPHQRPSDPAAPRALTRSAATSPLHRLQGQIYDLALANNMLFSAGQDGSIRVWSFNSQGEIFMCSVGCPAGLGRATGAAGAVPGCAGRG
jgi:WD40 repeat protein